MKTALKFLASLIILLIVVSCSNSSANDITPSGTSQNLNEGVWTVSYFEERGKNETSKFNGYQLTFDSGGVFILKNSSNTFTGSWSVSNNSDDSSNSTSRLIIYVSGNDAADQLQDDWIIVSQTNNSLELQDDSTNHSETLKLKKN
jgi:hypothetical protein